MNNYSKDEELRGMFNKFDVDESGFISKDEFITLVTQSKLEVQDTAILSFFNKIDTNNDGKLSFEEFKFFYTYNEGQFKEMMGIFGLYTQMAKYMKNLEQLDLNKLQQELNTNIVIKDNNLNDTNNLPTSIKLFCGATTDTKVQNIVQNKLTATNCICLKFHVDDVATVHKNLEEYLETLKELMGEFGPQVKEMFDLLPMEVVACDDGVMIVVNLDSHPMIEAYISMMEGPLQKIIDSKVSLSFEVGTSLDFDNYKTWTADDIYKETSYLCFNNQMINPSYLTSMPIVKENIDQLLATNNYMAISSMLSVMSLSKINLEVILDTSKKQKMMDMIGNLNGEQNLGEKLFGMIKGGIEESGVADMMEAFAFVGDLIKDLKKANMNGFSFVKKIGGLTFVTSVKANVFNLIKDSEVFDLD